MSHTCKSDLFSFAMTVSVQISDFLWLRLGEVDSSLFFCLNPIFYSKLSCLSLIVFDQISIFCLNLISWHGLVAEFLQGFLLVVLFNSLN